MSNEITITSTLKYSKNKASASLAGTFQASQTGDKYEAGVQSVGTSPEETIQKGDIGTIGYAMFRNMDPTNFVQLGAQTGQYTIKLNPGETSAAIPWNGRAVCASGNTAD